MNDVFNPRFRYKNGLTPEDEEVIRRLRCKGFAVAILSPVTVGTGLNRSPVEQAMVKAGKAHLKLKEARTA